MKSHGFSSRHPCAPVPLDNHVQAGCSVHRQLGSQRDQLSRERWPVGAESQQPRSCSTRHDKVPLAPCTLNLRSQHVPQLLSGPGCHCPGKGPPGGRDWPDSGLRDLHTETVQRTSTVLSLHVFPHFPSGLKLRRVSVSYRSWDPLLKLGLDRSHGCSWSFPHPYPGSADPGHLS